jgi:hypothetical protein
MTNSKKKPIEVDKTDLDKDAEAGRANAGSQ